MKHAAIKSSALLMVAVSLTACICGRDATGADKEAAPKKIIFANGGWKTQKDALPLMRYFVALTGKPNPKVCLLPTAQGDAAESIVSYYDLMNQLDCRPRHLRLFQPSRVNDFEEYLLDMDAIYVGGGNTLNMLAIWKDQGIDKVLHKAWQKGIVLGGGSAGAICWFQQGCTDSRPGKLTALDCLGWLPGSACPTSTRKNAASPIGSWSATAASKTASPSMKASACSTRAPSWSAW